MPVEVGNLEWLTMDVSAVWPARLLLRRSPLRLFFLLLLLPRVPRHAAASERNLFPLREEHPKNLSEGSKYLSALPTRSPAANCKW
jgi:hypothetical protein